MPRAEVVLKEGKTYRYKSYVFTKGVPSFVSNPADIAALKNIGVLTVREDRAEKPKLAEKPKKPEPVKMPEVESSAADSGESESEDSGEADSDTEEEKPRRRRRRTSEN